MHPSGHAPRAELHGMPLRNASQRPAWEPPTPAGGPRGVPCTHGAGESGKVSGRGPPSAPRHRLPAQDGHVGRH